LDADQSTTRSGAVTLDGPVVLILPPDTRMARVARLTASALGAFASFTVDDIDDLRIGVDELVVTLIEAGKGGPLQLRLELSEDLVRVTGETPLGDADGAPDPERFLLSERILDVVCDEHHLTVDDGVLRVGLAKRATS
jgi:hypothetical protein